MKLIAGIDDLHITASYVCMWLNTICYETATFTNSLKTTTNHLIELIVIMKLGRGTKTTPGIFMLYGFGNMIYTDQNKNLDLGLDVNHISSS